MGEQVERLKDHADVGPQPRQRATLLGDRLPVEQDAAAVDRLEPVDGPAQRRLPGARRPDDDHDLAAVDGQVDVTQGVDVPERLVDLLHLQQRLGH